MNGAGYKLLGFFVWRGGRWYLRRAYGHLIPSRRLATAGLVVAAIAVLALVVRRDGD